MITPNGLPLTRRLSPPLVGVHGFLFRTLSAKANIRLFHEAMPALDPQELAGYFCNSAFTINFSSFYAATDEFIR